MYSDTAFLIFRTISYTSISSYPLITLITTNSSSDNEKLSVNPIILLKLSFSIKPAFTIPSNMNFLANDILSGSFLFPLTNQVNSSFIGYFSILGLLKNASKPSLFPLFLFLLPYIYYFALHLYIHSKRQSSL